VGGWEGGGERVCEEGRGRKREEWEKDKDLIVEMRRPQKNRSAS
jgi:hypothetical protein